MKTLIYYRNDGAGDCENLKQQLCQISINEEQKLHIANPEEKVNKIDIDSFWEIRAKQQDLFSGSFSKNFTVSARLKRRKLR